MKEEILETKPPREQHFSVLGYRMDDGELNLAKEFKRVITLAFSRYPNQSYPDIAEMLGISVRTLHRVVKFWEVDTGGRKYLKYKNIHTDHAATR